MTIGAAPAASGTTSTAASKRDVISCSAHLAAGGVVIPPLSRDEWRGPKSFLGESCRSTQGPLRGGDVAWIGLD
jgi:hypothetical protein